MQPYKRKRRTQRDMFVLGGWLFADLLLGLAMIFAVANTVGQAPPTPTPTASPDLLATADSELAFQQQESQQTIEALQGDLSDAEIAAQQTETARQAFLEQATQDAIAEATRSAMSEQDRATADAQATEAAIAADATIAALATEQASSDSDIASLNDELATNVAQATQAAVSIDEMSTQQAEVQQVATENAASGADAQATNAAAQDQIATSQAELEQARATSDAALQDAENAQATSDAASGEIGNAQATSDAARNEAENAQATSNAASQQFDDAQATSAALQEQVELNSLSPQPVSAIFQVDLNGVLAGDDDAIDDAVDSIGDALQPYLESDSCRVGFVLITSRSNELGQGVQLSDAIAGLIQQEFPEILPEPADGSEPQLASESIARPNSSPVGEVELTLFLNSGCEPAS